MRQEREHEAETNYATELAAIRDHAETCSPDERRTYLHKQLSDWTTEYDPDLDYADEYVSPRTFQTRNENPEYHWFLEKLREMLRESGATEEPAKRPDPIRWTGSQVELIALFELLDRAGLVDGFIRTNRDHSWKLLQTHFSSSGKPIKNLSIIYSKDYTDGARERLIEKLSRG